MFYPSVAPKYQHKVVVKEIYIWKDNVDGRLLAKYATWNG